MQFASYSERFAGAAVDRELDFPHHEYERRLGAIRERMVELGLDLLLVGSLANICYLTGFQTPSSGTFGCLFVPISGSPALQTIDHEYGCASYTGWLERIHTFRWYEPGQGQEQTKQLLSAFLTDTPRRVGVESEFPVPPVLLQSWAESDARKLEWADASGLINQVRRVKSDLEIEAMRESGRIVRASIDEAAAFARPQVRDSDVAAVLLRRMVEEGSEFVNMGPFVATGVRSAIIHTTWKRRMIASGDLVFIEAAAPFKRYNAPLMRTACMGAPDGTVVRLAAAVGETLDRLLATIRAGATGHEVSVEAAKGFKAVAPEIYFQGAFGYAVGLGLPPNWAEGSVPFIAHGIEDPLVAGMTLHLPVAARVVGLGGVAASETVLVTEQGCEVLTGGDRSMRIRRL